MPIQGDKDSTGNWYSPENTIRDKTVGNYCVSFNYSPDFESWLPYSITIHEYGSEGGSFYRALFTFRSEDEALDFYDKLSESAIIESYLP